MYQISIVVRDWMLIVGVLCVLRCSMAADGPMRGLVVERSDGVLWIGLPQAVAKGTVLDIRLVPGDTVIARATVFECTPESPFVAQARFTLTDPKGFIPVGAYAEASDTAVPVTDRPDGYKPVTLGSSDSKRLAFSAAAFFPTDSRLEDETGSIWPAFRLEYRTSDSARVTTSVGIGYYHKRGSFPEGENSASRDFRVYPVTFDGRFWMGGPDRNGRWFARVEAGAYTIRDRRTVAGVTSSDTVTTLGWLGGFGYESRRGHSAQIYYVDTSDTEFQGLALALGTRF